MQALNSEKSDPSSLDREQRLEEAVRAFFTPQRTPRTSRDEALLRRGAHRRILIAREVVREVVEFLNNRGEGPAKPAA